MGTSTGDKDPLSLISIYAKKHAPKVVPSVVKSPVKQDSMAQSLQKRGSRRSQIQEEIEEDLPSDDLERQSNQSIEEDIVEGSKGISSGGSSRE